MTFLNTLVGKLWNKLGTAKPDPNSFALTNKVWVELEGCSLYVQPHEYIGASILQSNSYEPHVTKVIERELKRGDVFLDIGANIGFFTMLASRIVGETGKVISFEPNPFNLQLIYSSVLKNAARNIHVYPYAASDSSGIARFLTVGSNGGMINQDDIRDTSMLVQTVVVDDLLQDEKEISLVKLDIEAHEASALKGMVKLIRSHEPRIITEFNPWAMRRNEAGDPQEYLDLLFGFGYRVAVIDPKGELVDVSSSGEVMGYQSSLGDERIHIDLFARPVIA